MIRILIVEDDHEIAAFLSAGLTAEGYDVAVTHAGQDLMDRLTARRADLVVLDRMLPDAEGADLCRQIRARGDGTLIVMLTARDALEDKLEGLRAGADDYMTKPFAFAELLARIEALVRRSGVVDPAPATGTLTFTDLRIDMARKVVSRQDQDLGLTATEFALLHFLVTHAEQVVSRMELLKGVWGYDFDPHTNVVEVYVSYLRKKIERGGDTRLIRNVRGFGYMISQA
ncbi:two-component system, OmpR family, response regulator MprA [Loktanella fryxellensis]|uniref:Two-component system, OmpR family, response regulator MprA n=1 Tax=Loktanella fryxellensis TaxID=245187 RepID=A0A1H7ZL56_9RHOB|nr:response regulator transcription factor [Loktanella fryxellensis]SEM58674.1 two-component system, OmpR family, response regulator MprA [Loktanella fryxellensis]